MAFSGTTRLSQVIYTMPLSFMYRGCSANTDIILLPHHREATAPLGSSSGRLPSGSHLAAPGFLSTDLAPCGPTKSGSGGHGEKPWPSAPPPSCGPGHQVPHGTALAPPGHYVRSAAASPHPVAHLLLLLGVPESAPKALSLMLWWLSPVVAAACCCPW